MEETNNKQLINVPYLIPDIKNQKYKENNFA